jgi:hypothetical protein
MEGQTKPRIYLRKIHPIKRGLRKGMTMWIWVGGNPAGQDWNLGSARLFTLAEALRRYAGELRNAERCA